LKILATSRELLGITGEARYHVPPLEYGLMGPQQVELMARTIDERDNLRAALEYAARADWERSGNSAGCRRRVRV
jgi:hypothetical protein